MKNLKDKIGNSRIILEKNSSEIERTIIHQYWEMNDDYAFTIKIKEIK